MKTAAQPYVGVGAAGIADVPGGRQGSRSRWSVRCCAAGDSSVRRRDL